MSGEAEETSIENYDILLNRILSETVDASAAFLSHSNGCNLASWKKEGKVGDAAAAALTLALARGSMSAQKLKRGRLKQAFLFIAGGQHLHYHYFADPLFVSIVAPAGANIALLRSFSRRIVGGLIPASPVGPDPANEETLHSNGNCGEMALSREAEIVRDVSCGQVVPLNMRRDAWLILAHRRRRLDKWGGRQVEPGGAPKLNCPVATLELIDRDIPRTYVGVHFFRSDKGRLLLRSLLCELAEMFPEIGYCQGINFVAAVALAVFNDPGPCFEGGASGISNGNSGTAAHSESGRGSRISPGGGVADSGSPPGITCDALTVVSALVWSVRSFYVPELPGFRRAIVLLRRIAKQQLGPLLLHLDELGVSMQMFASPWLQCLFCQPSVPLPLAMHILELQLCLGFEALARACVALMATQEMSLMHTDNRIQIMEVLQGAPASLDSDQFEPFVALALSFQIDAKTKGDLASIGSCSGDDDGRWARDHFGAGSSEDGSCSDNDKEEGCP